MKRTDQWRRDVSEEIVAVSFMFRVSTESALEVLILMARFVGEE